MSGLLKNLALAAASMTFLLLLLELLFALIAIQLVPLKLQAALPRGVRVLAQSSKASIVPEGYVALLGDSHAQGAGDWMLAVDHGRNPPFHSAHLIQERSGRDVLSFGVSGAGSLRALVTEPITTLDYLRLTTAFSVGDPLQFIFYFYEGNDLGDNVRDLELRFAPDFDMAQVRDVATFQRFVDEVVIGESRLATESRSWSPFHNLYFTRSLARGLGAMILRRWPDASERIDWSIRDVNEARIGGSPTPLPNGLQSPALGLTEEEIDLALWVVERAFIRLREHFSEIPTLVVYLPSPLTTYRITSQQVSVQPHLEGRDSLFPTSLVAAQSDRICARVAAVAASAGADFVDARRRLWPIAEREPVHGPHDWKHLNRVGQGAMADTVEPWLERGEVEQPGCVSVARYFGGRP